MVDILCPHVIGGECKRIYESSINSGIGAEERYHSPLDLS